MEKKSNKTIIYWLCQSIGWGLLTIINSSILYFEGSNVLSIQLISSLLSFFIGGILVTHVVRFIIKHFELINLKLEKYIPIILLFSVLSGVFIVLIILGMDYIVSDAGDEEPINWLSFFRMSFSMAIVCLIWTLLYSAYHYLESFQIQKMRSIQLEASQKEIELENLKKQLNPHFIFNAMNSIRALVDEEPYKAKKSITHLSNLLRGSLKIGTNQLIQLEDELKFVLLYLELEKIRYEDRLSYKVENNLIDSSVLFPPLMLQTLVENAIKHGIANSMTGGQLNIITEENDSQITVRVQNTGQLLNNLQKNKTAIGIINSQKRLNLLFPGKSQFNLIQHPDQIVEATVIIPKIFSTKN